VSLNDAVVRGVLWVAYRALIAWAFVRRPHIRGTHVFIRQAGTGGGPPRVLVIRNSYKAGTTVPCGGIKRNESPRDAGVREVAEEVGLVLDPEALIEETVITVVASWRTDHAHFFRVELEADGNVVPRIDRREVVWAKFVPESELDALHLVPHLKRYLTWLRETDGVAG
jgi:8-oxo-dGTP pyrophosphatase MutT (NUDIX family)